MGWNNATKAADSFRPQGRYFKLDDGKKAKLLFLGEPMVRFSRWADGRSVVESGPVNGAGPRYISVVYNLDAGICQQMEMSPTVFRQVGEEIGAAPDPSKLVVNIKRTGLGKETTYSVMEAGQVDEQRYREAGQADMARDWDIGDLEGIMTLDEALALAGDEPSKLSASPPPASGAAPDDDIPFSQPRA